jgi:tagatose 6-phosphate kinase
MIVTVTLNLALDVTYRVPRLEPGATHRVSVDQRAGGKGVNVARVIRALGVDAVVCGFAGCGTGRLALADLEAAGIAARTTAIAAESRRTVAVVDTEAGEATGFWEPGPAVTDAEWAALLRDVDEELARARALVLSGSLPPGVPPDAYAVLGARAARSGVPVVLDADGDALRLGLSGRPEVVKPNREELASVAGTADVREGAARLRGLGARSVVASLGAEGLLAMTEEGCWRARPAQPAAGNPTGAGDAAVAALALGLVRGSTWPDRLAEAVALSAAAVSAPLAGSFDDEAYRRQRAAVTVEALPMAAVGEGSSA